MDIQRQRGRQTYGHRETEGEIDRQMDIQRHRGR